MSGLGAIDEAVLPQGWQEAKIGDHFEFKNGLNKAKHFFGHGTPIINYMDVYRHPWLLPFQVSGKVSVTRTEQQAYSAKQHDAFFTRTSETVAEIGMCSVLMGPIESAVFSGFVLRARPVGDGLLPGFAAYALRGRKVREQIESSATYTTRALTNGRSLSAVNFVLPPRQEQQRITSALRDIDDLLASLDALIAKKRDIKQAAMQQLIGGLVRLPGYSDEWSETSLRHVTSQRVTYGIVKAGEFQSDGVRMLRGGDISNGAIVGDPPFVTEAKNQEFARTILQENDVVVALVGYPGEAAVVPEWLVGGNISRAVGLIRPNPRLSSRYLCHYLNSPEGRKSFLRPSAGSAQIVVNLKDLDSLPLLLPSVREQESISDAIDDMCADLLEQENKRKKLALLKEGVMQQLLSGRIRLV